MKRTAMVVWMTVLLTPMALVALLVGLPLSAGHRPAIGWLTLLAGTLLALAAVDMFRIKYRSVLWTFLAAIPIAIASGLAGKLFEHRFLWVGPAVIALVGFRTLQDAERKARPTSGPAAPDASDHTKAA